MDKLPLMRSTIWYSAEKIADGRIIVGCVKTDTRYACEDWSRFVSIVLMEIHTMLIEKGKYVKGVNLITRELFDAVMEDD